MARGFVLLPWLVLPCRSPPGPAQSLPASGRCFKAAEPFVGVRTAGNHRSPNHATSDVALARLGESVRARTVLCDPLLAHMTVAAVARSVAVAVAVSMSVTLCFCVCGCGCFCGFSVCVAPWTAPWTDCLSLALPPHLGVGPAGSHREESQALYVWSPAQQRGSWRPGSMPAPSALGASLRDEWGLHYLIA